MTLTRDERRALIDWDTMELTLKTQAALLSLNRSGLYYQLVPPRTRRSRSSMDNIFTERLWRTKSMMAQPSGCAI